MVLGQGLLANIFKEFDRNNDIIIFASGVSNSNEIKEEVFQREEKLLEQTIKNNPNKILIYFSSCDVIYAQKFDKAYYFHKLNMENIIKTKIKEFYIFRLPQLIGKSNNKHSLINYFIHAISNGKEIMVWQDAYKNLIDIRDIKIIVKYFIDNSLQKNTITNIINKNYYSIQDIITTLEEFLGIKAHIKMIKKGFLPNYPRLNILDDIGIEFNDDYLKKSISKNYQEI